MEIKKKNNFYIVLRDKFNDSIEIGHWTEFKLEDDETFDDVINTISKKYERYEAIVLECKDMNIIEKINI